MMPPLSGTLTRRSSSGVQASIRASGTRAHTRAVQPDGTVRRCGVDSAPPPSPAGTTRVVVESACGGAAAADMEDSADADAVDDGAVDDGPVDDDAVGAVPCPWLAAGEQAATATTVVAAKASGKRRKCPVMISPPVR